MNLHVALLIKNGDIQIYRNIEKGRARHFVARRIYLSKYSGIETKNLKVWIKSMHTYNIKGLHHYVANI